MADDTEAPMTRERMRADLARILRMDPEEIGGDDDLGDLGLDSLRAMNILLKWNENGLDLDFGELAENLTLDSWWAAARRKQDQAGGG